MSANNAHTQAIEDARQWPVKSGHQIESQNPVDYEHSWVYASGNCIGGIKHKKLTIEACPAREAYTFIVTVNDIPTDPDVAGWASMRDAIKEYNAL